MLSPHRSGGDAASIRIGIGGGSEQQRNPVL